MDKTNPSSDLNGPSSLVGLSRADLRAALADMGVPEKQLRMRTGQLWSWLYARGATDWDEMTDMSKNLRASLAERHSLARLDMAERHLSEDGTRKYLFRLADGQLVETVYIPAMDRGTLCISSQVGCTLTCRFCHTGTQKLVRNLTCAEIVGQMVAARDDLADWGEDTTSNSDRRKVTNVVMMGMGEPLYNSEGVADALNVMSDGNGLSLSRRRITLSTSGVVPEIVPMGEKTGVMLAISLHAVSDELRNELVPINAKHPVEELLEACWDYAAQTNSKQITFEYIMLDGVNDSRADAEALVRLLKGKPAKVNLIPFNPVAGTPYGRTPQKRVDAFRKTLMDKGVITITRRPRGDDIDAACGQLSAKNND